MLGLACSSPPSDMVPDTVREMSRQELASRFSCIFFMRDFCAPQWYDDAAFYSKMVVASHLTKKKYRPSVE